MESDDLSLAFHAIRGDTAKVKVHDGILVWLPSSSSSSSSSSSGTENSHTGTNTDTIIHNTNTTATGNNDSQQETSVTIDPVLSSLVLMGCRRVQELTHNHPTNKTEALNRGILAILSTSVFTTPNEPAHHHPHHHHRKHHMGVPTVALRALKSVIFKHEIGKRAAGPSGIVLQTLGTLRYALHLLEKDHTNTVLSIDEFTLGLGLVEETLTTLVALCTGAGGEDNLTLVKEGGNLTLNELQKATDTLTALQTNWSDTPLGKYQKTLVGTTTDTIRTILPLTLVSGVSPTITPSESLKRLVFLQALL